MNLLDRAIEAVSPTWGARRLQARVALASADKLVGQRHFEAAAHSRRTEGWARTSAFADSDLAAQGALGWLRGHSRDLIRNNGWARRAQRVIANNTISWGIVPKASGSRASETQALWKRWAGSTDCSVDGRRTFAAIQHLVMRSLVESGEVLIRRRYRRAANRSSPINLELAVLEADYIDSTKQYQTSDSGGPIVCGVEFDAHGRRAGYWLYDEHPGSGRSTSLSRFVPAMDVLHIYEEDRPGQTRGVSWLAAAIVPLKDLADLEDAELVKQKVAACFAALVTDTDGQGSPMGEQSETNALVETLSPGMVLQLPVGKSVTFGTPPQAMLDNLPTRTLRRVCAALGVVYEEVSGDWSQVNFSSARMARLAHWGNVHHWQQNIVIPLLCQPVWEWFCEAADLGGLLGPASDYPTAEWTPPPMPMLEPAKEGDAYKGLIRSGMMSLPGALREQGFDPDAHLREVAESNATLDRLGLVLDCDPRRVTAQGQTQQDKPQPKSASKAPAAETAQEDTQQETT